jgi:hypothetical protein
MSEEKHSYRSVTRKLTSTGNGVAALFSSLLNTLIAYPLDVIKTRFQGNVGILSFKQFSAQDPLLKNIRYSGTFQALRTIISQEGVR